MPITRHGLLTQAAWSLGGASLLAAVSCARDARWREVVAPLEDRIPRVMTEFTVAGLSIALIRERASPGPRLWSEQPGFEDRSGRRHGVRRGVDEPVRGLTITRSR